MAIKFIGEQVNRPLLKYRDVKCWLNYVLKANGFKTGNICYIFCNDEYLKNINFEYLKHDYFTDIVTFEYSEENLIHGDMFISIDRVKENALIYQCSIGEEYLRVMVHGLLHLLGFGDKDEEERNIMRLKENEYLYVFNNLS